MFFPISDDDRHISGPYYVTWTLLAANIAVFIYQLINPEFTTGWSVIPQEITTGTDLISPETLTVGGQDLQVPQVPGPGWIYFTLISSMFMHGGFMHLGGNLLYLWIFGNNVEHRFGPFRFLVFYVASGLAASALQISLDPDGVIPNLGASGAISGVLGAYLVLFPRNKVNALLLYFVITVPAMVVLGMWFVMQFVSGIGSIATTEQTAGGVAYGAHIGGFLAGVLVALVVRGLFHGSEPDSVLKRQYDSDPTSKRYW